MFTQKILYVGNETEATDLMVSQLAVDNNTVNHGLIIDAAYIPDRPGYYHTTVVDLSAGEIAAMAKYFDLVSMLDQPKESYPHWKSFISTFRLMYDLSQSGFNVDYLDKGCNRDIAYWHQTLRENKSVCFYPFLGFIDNLGSNGICPKNLEFNSTKLAYEKDWANDPHFNSVREKMLKGELNPVECGDCYNRESQGQESARRFETLEWAVRMNFQSINDLATNISPAYYELRPSNKCNVMCRTCDNQHSHLIDKEWKTIGIQGLPYNNKSNTSFDKINFDSVKKIYVGGGEPTVISEFYDFLEECIRVGKTDFELVIGTNGMKFSDKILKLFDHFSDVCFSVSFDGYKKVNDYIRWGTEFDTVLANGRMLLDRGHKVGLQTVFSIYNATNMHEIFEFYDDKFPECSSLVQYGGFKDDIMDPYNHPNPELVIKSMERCTKTKVYYANGRSCKSMIDSMLLQYSKNYHCDIDKLRQFYEFNDKLDQSRGSRLIDYIPELAQGRSIV
jgi:MoaA/NifB/PqqE/SkfB family radical SAM enzyme